MTFPISRTYPPCVIGSVADTVTLRSLINSKQDMDCDMLELRVDGLLSSGMTIDEMKHIELSKPMLLTVRTPEEGGLYPFADVQSRADIAMQLLSRAAALDWEIAHLEEVPHLVQAAQRAGVPIIASAHDFVQTPAVESLSSQEILARKWGADVVKFAFSLNCAEDITVGINLLRQATGAMAVMGMGALGPVSRLLYAQHGSCLIYGYMGDTPTAPGQWGTAQFRSALQSLLPCKV